MSPGGFNPVLAESEVIHRMSVDQLKWELGHPVPCPLPLAPAGFNPRYYYYYYYYGYPHYGYPWTAAANHYSAGFRDGLKSAGRPDVAVSEGPKPQAAKTAPTCEASAGRCYPGDLMGFPSASYRRALRAYPVCADTSYDNLATGWPFGCKPFYFRHADPPSVRYF